MRLIDADIFASELDFAEADVCEEFPDSYCECGFSREKIRELLRDIPTVDAIPVVRCRECDHKTHDENGKPYCLQLEMYLNKELDFFCKYGERKEGAENEP